MKKVVAEVILLSNKSFYPRIYCIDQYGVEDDAVSMTLCEAVWELNGDPIAELEKLIKEAFVGIYSPNKPELPDMSINDKLIWVRPPFAVLGQVCISNENVPEFSVDEGAPQCFTLSQVQVVAKLASDFLCEIANKGRENLFGSRFVADLPSI